MILPRLRNFSAFSAIRGSNLNAEFAKGGLRAGWGMREFEPRWRANYKAWVRLGEQRSLIIPKLPKTAAPVLLTGEHAKNGQRTGTEDIIESWA
jgi:hypothetical protein